MAHLPLTAADLVRVPLALRGAHALGFRLMVRAGDRWRDAGGPTWLGAEDAGGAGVRLWRLEPRPGGRVVRRFALCRPERVVVIVYRDT